jgi:hypothetical protein
MEKAPRWRQTMGKSTATVPQYALQAAYID